MYIRWRFYANLDDPRPITFPPAGPWWVSGSNDDNSVIVTWLPAGLSPRIWWPEAEDIEELERAASPEFSDRFPMPQWWGDLMGTAAQFGASAKGKGE